MQCITFKACSGQFCVLFAGGCEQAVETFIAVCQGDGGMKPGRIPAVFSFIAKIAVMQGVISPFKGHACGRICGMAVQKGEKRLNLFFGVFTEVRQGCGVRPRHIRMRSGIVRRCIESGIQAIVRQEHRAIVGSQRCILRRILRGIMPGGMLRILRVMPRIGFRKRCGQRRDSGRGGIVQLVDKIRRLNIDELILQVPENVIKHIQEISQIRAVQPFKIDGLQATGKKDAGADGIEPSTILRDKALCVSGLQYQGVGSASSKDIQAAGLHQPVDGEDIAAAAQIDFIRRYPKCRWFER